MLRPLVGRRVQGLFHSPVRGSFHLSLTVLVRYRDGPRWFAQDFSCPALLRIPLGFRLNSLTGLSPSLAACSKAFCFKSSCHLVVLLPRWRRNTIGLGSSAFARHYLRNHFCFLLLRVLRCFSSPRSLPPAFASLCRDDRPPACRVAPFGYPGIKGYLHLPPAFRSLSRPSSPPRA